VSDDVFMRIETLLNRLRVELDFAEPEANTEAELEKVVHILETLLDDLKRRGANGRHVLRTQ